jgi:hypothetical protein
MRRIAREVADSRWCGGLSWSELADALNVREHDKTFIASVWACRRRGQVDMCRDYVVAVPEDDGDRAAAHTDRPADVALRQGSSQ